jgi:hypothetical protein
MRMPAGEDENSGRKNGDAPVDRNVVGRNE